MTDGPFTETKELIARFWIWQCKSKEEAVEWTEVNAGSKDPAYIRKKQPPGV